MGLMFRVERDIFLFTSVLDRGMCSCLSEDGAPEYVVHASCSSIAAYVWMRDTTGRGGCNRYQACDHRPLTSLQCGGAHLFLCLSRLDR